MRPNDEKSFRYARNRGEGARFIRGRRSPPPHAKGIYFWATPQMARAISVRAADYGLSRAEFLRTKLDLIFRNDPELIGYK